ncbi:MAG: hypothetical protein WC497_04860 [Patescibacteria group bacterium]
MTHTLSTAWFPFLIGFAGIVTIAAIFSRLPVFYPRPKLLLFGITGIIVLTTSWLLRFRGNEPIVYAGTWVGMMAGLAYPIALQRLKRQIRRMLVR